MKDILTQKDVSTIPLEIAKFTSSVESDTKIVEAVIKINKAHVIMLFKQGIINLIETKKILSTLSKITFNESLDPRLEDIHMHIETKVIKKLGDRIGGKLHIAKSRNDQVATAIRMKLREYLLDIVKNLIDFRKVLLDRCGESTETIMPGYTHLQQGQPTTFAHVLLSYHDVFERDTKRLREVFGRVNLSPMGACAFATTSFKLDRHLIAELLGFHGLIENSIDAVSSRDFIVETLSALALIMTNLSKIGEDIVIWSTSEFATIFLPEEYVSTSSIMPQKRNPEVAELFRGKTAHVYGDLIAALTILKSLPTGYNLDLQEINDHLWNACEVTSKSIQIATGMVKGLKVKEKRWKELLNSNFSTATELADILVREHDMSFRTAYSIVKKLVNRISNNGKKISDITKEMVIQTVEEHTGKKIIIDEEKIRKTIDFKESVENKIVIGGPKPEVVLFARKERIIKNTVDAEWLQIRDSLLKKYDEKLHKSILEIM